MTESKTALQTRIAAARAHLGVGLFALACDFSRKDMAQAAREAAIKATKRRRRSLDGKSGVRYLREQVDACSALIRESREMRQQSRRRTTTPAGITHPRVDPIRRLYKGGRQALENRLAHRLDAEIGALVASAYRLDSAGSLDIEITRDPSAVGVKQAESFDRDFYAKSYRTAGGFRPAKKITDTEITVPAAWWSRVKHQDLTEVDGMLTLDAQRAEGAPADVDLYAAAWLEQGRGYELRATRGYIARDTTTGAAYHGADARKALLGLNRKLTGRKISAQLEDLLAKHGIGSLVERAPNLTVSIADARLTGACEYGIASWCNRCGLPYEAGQATLAEVYACYKKHPMPEARAAILHAIRRQKRAVLKTA